MPVSPLPILIPLLAICLCIAGGICATSASKKKYSRRLAGVGIAIIALPPILVKLVALVLLCGAMLGNCRWQYGLSRWLESENDMVSSVSMIQFDRHFEQSWYWLERASTGGCLAATYTIGNRIKHDRFVPTTINKEVDFQTMMNQALNGGFRLKVPEEQYYFGQFRIQVPVF